MRQVFAILFRVNHLPILLGTSSFTAAGWEGSFYPRMRPADYLAFYAERFHMVEVDSTFYACPTHGQLLGGPDSRGLQLRRQGSAVMWR
jgi:Protein of unknown function DUF72